MNAAEISGSQDHSGSRYEILDNEYMHLMQIVEKEHVQQAEAIKKNQGNGPRQPNQPKASKKDLSSAQKARPHGKINSQNKAQQHKNAKSAMNVGKSKEVSTTSEGKKPTSDEKTKVELEILRAMQRVHKEICAKYADGLPVDILGMDANYQSIHAHAEASCSAMDMVMDPNEAKPPDPKNSQQVMEMVTGPDNRAAEVLVTVSNNGGPPRREV